MFGSHQINLCHALSLFYFQPTSAVHSSISNSNSAWRSYSRGQKFQLFVVIHLASGHLSSLILFAGCQLTQCETFVTSAVQLRLLTVTSRRVYTDVNIRVWSPALHAPLIRKSAGLPWGWHFNPHTIPYPQESPLESPWESPYPRNPK